MSDFENLLNQIQNEQPDPAVEQEAANRVWSRVSQHARIRGCNDFQAMIPDWKAGVLSEARVALLKDHIHGCVDCRHAAEAGKVIQFPGLAGQAAAPRKATIWQLPVMRYAMAAGLFAVLGIGGWGVLRSILNMGPRMFGSRATVQTADGQLFRLHGAGLLPVKAGEELPAGEEVRTGRNSHAVIRLKDGSMVEMRERTAFRVEESTKDLNVKLSRGAVIVQASKQYKLLGGHLYVTTPDCKVAVTGTVFSVDSGVKGSRVSVADGEVHVTPENEDGAARGAEVVLHPGDQTSTDASMERTPIREEFSWSMNSEQHMAMLATVAKLQKDLESIQQPGMRYQSRILSRLPENTVLYMAIPNVGEQLGQAQQMVEKRVQESPVLQQWWKQQGDSKGNFNKVLDSLRGLSSYLGDEVVVTATYGRGQNGRMEIQSPIILAEVKRSGLQEYLKGDFAALLKDAGGVSIVDDSTPGAQMTGLPVVVTNDMMAMTIGTSRAHDLAVDLKRPATARASTAFLSRIEQSYQQGVGFLFAADLGTMSATIAGSGPDAQARVAPLGNVNHMIVEQRDMGATTDTHALVTFNGPRKGIWGWLGKPSPMAALDYVTATATVVSGFAVQNPGQVVDDILAWTSANDPNATKNLAEVEQELGFSLRNDLAASLGSEFVFSLDGPLLPIPSWKVVAEVYDPQKLQWVFTQMVADANRKIATNGGAQLQSTQQEQNGLTYYKIVYPDATPLAEIDYVFTGGYVIAAPSKLLLDAAIAAKQNGNTLTRSAAFRSALPHDRQANFSALAYSNAGTAISSALTSLSKMASPELRKSLQGSASDSGPSLIGAYGEEDRIVVSTQGLSGMGSAALLKLAGPFSAFSMIQNSSMHGTKH